jgi:ubiquinone/menaquinone biosynthesis C-methylase UbiE
VHENLRDGISVLELDCGSGAALIALAGKYPNSQFVGLQSSDAGVETGRARARELGLSNVIFHVGQIADPALDRAYDLVLVCRASHDRRELPLSLAHAYRTLKANGALLLRTFAGSNRLENNLHRPGGALLCAISLLRAISGPSATQESASVAGHEPVVDLLHDIGFRHVRVVEMPRDPLYAYFVCERM